MYAKLQNGELITPPKSHKGLINNYDSNEAQLRKDGWKQVIYTNPGMEPEEGQELYFTYEENPGCILQLWDVRDIPIPVLIERAQAQLTQTDYKIIKCAEYQLAGLEAPYDVSALHEERQNLRDKINELEGRNELDD